MRALLRLKHYLKPYLPHLFGSMALALPLAALRVGPVPLVKYLVDHLLVDRDPTKLKLIPIAVIGLYAINFVVRFFHYYLLRIVVAGVNRNLKNDLFKHISGLSADYFTSTSTGTLISRVGSDPQYIDGGLSAFNTFLREPVTFLFLLGYALKLNWKLTIITFLIFPPLGYVFSYTGKYLKRYIARIQESNAQLFSTLQESFTGIRVIKMFRLQEYVRTKFEKQSGDFYHFLMKTAVLEEASHPMVELLTSFAIAGVVYYGGSLVIHGQMTSGDLIAFFTAFALMINPLRMLNDLNIKLNQAAAACDRIFQIFDLKSNLHESEHPRALAAFQSGIEFKNVRFAYPDAREREILKGVSFQVPKGRTIALVGASGAGKSSLVSLLPRIFDVTGGSIEVDGLDIREYKLDDLRSQIAVVSQDVFLFNDTIEQNIRCGRFEATHEEIMEAARRAHALEYIAKLSDGIQTVIGERGQKLSGGERQRLSIARAFLREAPILILDEATSSLDTASERAVQKALEELMKNRTTIIIAHRLSTVQNADQILVLREGQLVETGTHSELLARNGEYARFHKQGAVE